ncbi:MAG: HAD-IA family hydrolase, partial [Myxococcota bacterium]
MLPAIFFDMDGVLVDSEPEWQRAEIEVFAELGVTLRPEDCRQTKGMRIDEVVRYWYERRPWSGVSLDEAVERIISAMESRLRTRAVAKPGAVTALQAARNVARCVAIVSSSPHRLIRAVVERLAVAEHLDFSVSGEDVSYGKPHPEIYLYAAERAEIRPEQAWVIEDSLFGMIA